MPNYTRIFDSHAHYNDEKFAQNQAEVIRHITENGVCAILNAGCDMESSRSGITLCDQYPFFYC